MSAVAVSLKEVRFYMRNVRTRMPFKYGVATLTSVPILHLRLDGELDGHQPAQGWAADILPPKWFDKDPQKEYEDNIDDLIAVDIATEAVLHRVIPDRDRDFPVEFVVVLVIVGEAAIDSAAYDNAAVQVAVIIDSAVSGIGSVVEGFCCRLQARQSHVNVMLLY